MKCASLLSIDVHVLSVSNVTRIVVMRKNVRKQIRLSEELLKYINENYENASQFIRTAIRDRVEADRHD